MSRSRYAVLPLVIGLFAAAACTFNPTGVELCLHSEGCSTGGGFGWTKSELSFHGLVASASTGQSLAGVTVRIDAPARGWSESVLTSSTGYYYSTGLLMPIPGDCSGLSVTFSREGFQPLRVIDFPLLTCGPGYLQLNASLTPTP